MFLLVGCSSNQPNRVVVVIEKSATITSDYDNNEMRADELYRGKWIQTTGYFDEIDGWGQLVFRSNSWGGGRYGLACIKISKLEKSKIQQFNSNDLVTFIGFVEGNEARFIIFTKCEFPDY
jgi:hypothetical protein